MFTFVRNIVTRRGRIVEESVPFIFFKGVNAWYTGKVVRSRITGRPKKQIAYTINSRGRTGAAERSKLMRRAR